MFDPNTAYSSSSDNKHPPNSSAPLSYTPPPTRQYQPNIKREDAPSYTPPPRQLQPHTMKREREDQHNQQPNKSSRTSNYNTQQFVSAGSKGVSHHTSPHNQLTEYAEVQSVATHYNAMPNLGRVGRQESKIIHMKSINNWIKSVLISSYCRSGFSVFDMCGGKAGDLNKWQHGRISHLVLSDVALVSVQHAVQRYNEQNNASFPALFMAADCFAVTIADYIPKEVPSFDLVSMQFALHYSFESEVRARKMMENVTSRLKPGGYFIGTIPNANLLVKRVRSSSGLSFGNSIYSVTFDQKDTFPKYGCRYQFYLQEAVNNVPEYLVHFPTLVKLAAEHGLDCILKESFHDFYASRIRNEKHLTLFKKMKFCVDPETGTISDDEWEALGIYMVFAFKKRGEHWPTPPQPSFRKKLVTDGDIIIVSPN